MATGRRILAAVLLAATLARCGTPPARRADGGPDTVFVIDRGWHTDIGLPVDELRGPLLVFQHSFPGVRVLVFGFGARGYLLSRRPGFGDMLAALLPAPGAILVTALRAPPAAAFGAGHVVALRVSRDGFGRIAGFVWRALERDGRGAPRLLANGPYPGSAFYASADIYDAFRTCNTWTAEALRAGGLPIGTTGIVFAGQVMDEARRVAARQHAAPPMPAAGIGPLPTLPR